METRIDVTPDGSRNMIVEEVSLDNGEKYFQITVKKDVACLEASKSGGSAILASAPNFAILGDTGYKMSFQILMGAKTIEQYNTAITEKADMLRVLGGGGKEKLESLTQRLIDGEIDHHEFKALKESLQEEQPVAAEEILAKRVPITVIAQMARNKAEAAINGGAQSSTASTKQPRNIRVDI